MSDVKITVLKGGPLLVTGAIELANHDGTAIATKGDMCKLCRCGASVKKPFCDGTHNKIGFEAAESTVPNSQ